MENTPTDSKDIYEYLPLFVPLL